MFEVIINPAGAGGRTVRTWNKTKELLDRYHISWHENFSTPEHGIREIVSGLTAGDSEVDLLVIGGDGSMNETVNGIRDIRKVRLALIPCGTGNDLARALAIPSDPETVVRQLQDNQVKRRISVGKMTMHTRYDRDLQLMEGEYSRLFNISSGFGFDAAVCEEVQRSAVKPFLNKIHLGKLIYLYVAVHQIFSADRIRCRIVLDDCEMLEFSDLLLSVGMNSAYEGGGFRFAPAADPSDDFIDFCFGDHITRMDFFRVVPKAYSGAHVNYPGFHLRRAEYAEITTDRPVWIHTDGEIEWQSDQIRLELLPDRLKLLV